MLTIVKEHVVMVGLFRNCALGIQPQNLSRLRGSDRVSKIVDVTVTEII